MVSLNNILIIDSYYMALNGGYKPLPRAFIKFFKDNNIKPNRVFFLGNRLVDMELADNIKEELNCEIYKCLIKRNPIRIKYNVNKIVNNLRDALRLINKFKPDLILSDFDNTLFHSGYDSYEDIAERTRFWEKHGSNKLVMLLHELLTIITSLIIKRKPYKSLNDNTELFIKSLKTTLIIHSMSSRVVIMKSLKKLLG